MVVRRGEDRHCENLCGYEQVGQRDRETKKKKK
jgi:hypothetical protein